jgi:DNA-binding transcriptional regulator YdaS (Cro superfamily)
MTLNWPLKIELIRRYGSQFKAAHAMGLHESRLSQIIRGRVRPNTAERTAFERVLGKALAQQLLESDPIEGR